VLWFTLWFMVILKIPALYLALVIWWAVKDPPGTATGPAADGLGEGGGPGWRPNRDRPRTRRPGRGPHDSPLRRPSRVRVAAASAGRRSR
jgi:hypothetical protein